MLLIKEIYTLPDQTRDLIELRDGTLYTFCITPGRALKMSDLEPYNSPLPRELALAASHAKPYDAGLRGLQMKFFGLTDCPLKAARIAAGMTQTQLADASGVHSRQIQRIENGEATMANITLSNALKIADALGVDVKDLI